MRVGSTEPSLRSPLPAASAPKAGGATADVKDEFLKYARMTPAERIRESVLKAMRLEEKDLAAMDDAQRKSIEDAIKEKVFDLMRRKQESITGVLTDYKI